MDDWVVDGRLPTALADEEGGHADQSENRTRRLGNGGGLNGEWCCGTSRSDVTEFFDDKEIRPHTERVESETGGRTIQQHLQSGNF